MKAANAAFNASVDAGVTLFDTAEVYGSKVVNCSTL
jgi:aryl-alcohol dehydrogenase-like predicted oxidoreductase